MTQKKGINFYEKKKINVNFHWIEPHYKYKQETFSKKNGWVDFTCLAVQLSHDQKAVEVLSFYTSNKIDDLSFFFSHGVLSETSHTISDGKASVVEI